MPSVDGSALARGLRCHQQVLDTLRRTRQAQFWLCVYTHRATTVRLPCTRKYPPATMHLASLVNDVVDDLDFMYIEKEYCFAQPPHLPFPHPPPIPFTPLTNPGGKGHRTTYPNPDPRRLQDPTQEAVSWTPLRQLRRPNCSKRLHDTTT